MIGNTVLAMAEVNTVGDVTQVRVLQGVSPFRGESVKAISQWKFEPVQLDGHAVASQVSVLIMFRPHAFSHEGLGGPSFGFTPPEVPKGDHPVLPHFIFDPGWPLAPRYLNEGVVVFELDITESGRVDGIRTVRDVPATADYARDIVKQWDASRRKQQADAIKNCRGDFLCQPGASALTTDAPGEPRQPRPCLQSIACNRGHDRGHDRGPAEATEAPR